MSRCNSDTVVTIGKDSLAIIQCLATKFQKEVAGGLVVSSCGGKVSEIIMRTDMSDHTVNNYFANEISFHTHPHANSPSAQDLWIAVVRSLVDIAYSTSIVFDHAGAYVVEVERSKVDMQRTRAWLQERHKVWQASGKPQRHNFVRVVNRGVAGMKVRFVPWSKMQSKLVMQKPIRLLTGQDGNAYRIKQGDLPVGVNTNL